MKQILLQTNNSSLWVIPNFTEDYYDQIKTLELNEEPEIIVYGRKCRQHRDVGFYSNISEGYRHSGNIARSRPLTPLLSNIMEHINAEIGTDYNSILVNKYRDGSKYIGAHSDDERGLSNVNKSVASLCYGPGVRNFRIRDKQTKRIVLNYDHQPCTLLIMDGNFQQEFTHEIPKQLRIKEERISLTFRNHIN